ncbi:hypothetical protein GWK47_030758 [Chionoecetes opilio]|uniref:Uncharacterized protein n=1 Tax=Chionoecetes opilio TaxID=41210 RepID=A0A8J4YVI9_CHIOP|nr:hypothetical protein GWK47_030758 [Chionoecetes opilio]
MTPTPPYTNLWMNAWMMDGCWVDVDVWSDSMTPHDTTVLMRTEMRRHSWQHMADITAILSEGGEAAVNAVPTYLQACDLQDAATLASRELNWTLLRQPSVPEDDDNGNAS